jgi:hypothetical protein
MRGLIDGELWVPWHHFLAMDLVPGRTGVSLSVARCGRLSA